MTCCTWTRFGGHRGQARRQPRFEGDALVLRLGARQRDDAQDGLVQIERLLLRRAILDQTANAANDVAGPLPLVEDPFQCLSRLGDVRRLLREPSQ